MKKEGKIILVLFSVSVVLFALFFIIKSKKESLPMFLDSPYLKSHEWKYEVTKSDKKNQG